jgi:hypothetical protein
VAYEQLPECLYTDAQPCKDSVLAKQLDAAQLSASQALQKAIQSHDAAALNDARQSLDLFGSLLNPKDN